MAYHQIKYNNNTDNKQQQFYTKAIESLAIITELDDWYTALTRLTKNNVLKSTCSNYILTGYWLVVILIMIILYYKTVLQQQLQRSQRKIISNPHPLHVDRTLYRLSPSV